MNTGKLIKNVVKTTRHLFAAMILFFIGLACQYIIRFARNLADLITYNMEKSVSQMQWEHFRKNSVGRYDNFYKIAIDNEHSDTPGNVEANEVSQVDLIHFFIVYTVFYVQLRLLNNP